MLSNLKANKKIYHIVAIFAFLLPIIIFAFPVIAANESGGDDDGDDAHSGCSGLGLSNCYGAKWQWYSLASGVTSVNIPDSGYSYAPGDSLSGCNMGGYWRHSMVAAKSMTLKGKTYAVGDQVGSTWIGGHTGDDEWLNSEAFYGWDSSGDSAPHMHERSRTNWNTAESVYASLQRQYPTIYTRGWSVNSELATFCGKSNPNTTVTFSSSSKVDSVSGSTSSGGVYILPKETSETTVSFDHKVSSDPAGYTPSKSISTNIKSKPEKTGVSASGSSVAISDLPNGKTVKICQTISGTPKTGTYEEGSSTPSSSSGSFSSSACVTVYREAYIDYMTSTTLEVTKFGGSKNLVAEKDSSRDHTVSLTSTSSKITMQSNSMGVGNLSGRIFANSSNENNTINLKFTHNVGRKGLNINPYDDKSNGGTVSWKITDYDPRTGTVTGPSGLDDGVNYTQATSKTYAIKNSTDLPFSVDTKGIAHSTYNKTICQKFSATNGFTRKYGGTLTPDATDTYSGICAHLYRPYNFELSLTLESSQIPEVVYGGETISLKATVDNVENTRVDGQEGTHSASPDNTEVRFYVHDFDEYQTVDDVKSYFNNNLGDLIRTTTQPMAPEDNTVTATYSIGNRGLGHKICYIATINYKSSSINSIDLAKTGNLYGYNLAPQENQIMSKITCQVVAKKATFQVWGGSIFGGGSIAAFHYNDNGIVNGSWADYGVISNKTVDWVASAAGLEGGSTNNNTPSAMTIRNNDSVLGYANIAHSNNTRDQFRTRYSGNSLATKHASGTYNISTTYDKFNSATFTDTKNGKDKYRYTYIDRDATIYASEPLPTGTTHIIYATGDITIDGGDGRELRYFAGPYKNAFYLPQYIIIAKNIKINANVKNVSAILFAENIVNTCTESMSSDNAKREQCGINRLEIHGPIYADRVNLNRSSGSETEPAERIYNSASTYFWSAAQAEDYSKLVTTYIRKVAPRF